MRHKCSLLVCILTMVVVLPARDGRADEAANGFHPELVAIELAATQVRPGDPISLTLKFRNTGTEVALAEYHVFTHFEAPKKSCENIVVHADQVPADPTTLWTPNQLVIDGPYTYTVPVYGFIVESPQFVAFCLTRYNGVDFTSPTLFTARSLDGKPLRESGQVRIFHGFGDQRLRLFDKELSVAREAVVSLQ